MREFLEWDVMLRSLVRFGKPFLLNQTRSRNISCAAVAEHLRVSVFQEAVDTSLKWLACQFPSIEGFTLKQATGFAQGPSQKRFALKLSQDNPGSAASASARPSWYRFRVRQGWSAGCNVVLEATDKQVSGIWLRMVPASRGESSLLVLFLAAMFGTSAVLFVLAMTYHHDWVEKLGSRLGLALLIIGSAVLGSLPWLLLCLLLHLLSRAWRSSHAKPEEPEGRDPVTPIADKSLEQTFDALGEEIQRVVRQWSSA
jgi:hypothetical protein